MPIPLALGHGTPGKHTADTEASTITLYKRSWGKKLSTFLALIPQVFLIMSQVCLTKLQSVKHQPAHLLSML